MSESWRDRILREITPQVSRLTLAADPDGLLFEEGVMQGISERGFEVLPFDDMVAFRYAYESRFGSHWELGKDKELIVVVRSDPRGLERLPYDLLQAGRKLSFSLSNLFPNLNYPVIRDLPHRYLDALYEAQIHHPTGQLGTNATREYILRHVFEIAPELISKDSDLLRMLLRKHYQGQHIPAAIEERFIQVLHQNRRFEGWPLDTIVPDREAFFAFLQERWPLFLDRSAGNAGSSNKNRHLKYSGPAELPFEHDDVRIYIDNLFVEGLLQPVQHKKASEVSRTWAGVGVAFDFKADRLHRLERLIASAESHMPAEDSRYGDWLHFAFIWAELIALAVEVEAELPEATQSRIDSVCFSLDVKFLTWVQQRYSGLVNLPALPPVMLHHVPRFLARQPKDSSESKLAFLLVDGLSLDQWVVMRRVLAEQRPQLRYRENALFAWIPTITPVSRQAAFAGKPPFYFPSSINTTEKEPRHWTQFWMEEGRSAKEVAYQKKLGDELEPVAEILSPSKVCVVGLVIDKVDRILHGMELGTAGMHNQVHQWLQQGFMSGLLDLLFDRGFSVYLTSDHGNIAAVGCGSPKEGVIADVRGQRVRVYPDSALRSEVKKRFADAIEWPSTALPEDYLPLIAPGRSAFIREGESIVGHGGITIEEVIVPFIKIEKEEM